MSLATEDMDELDDRDRAVLEVLADGRANPYLIRDETGLDKGDTNTVLNRLGRSGYVRQITRGLYEITDRGREEVDAGGLDVDKLREQLREARSAHETGNEEKLAATLERMDYLLQDEEDA